ncbi:MAG: exosortase/archaeosortase family protein [Prevotellaceae bacterium]|jgi:exosortase/archaeosortase family protein|nr:exosortase/archaeosortase family protein [Prevotellaceae bacterium]
MNLRTVFTRLKIILSPYAGIIRFMAALLVTHFVWKYSIIGEEDANVLLLFNRVDISAPFLAASAHVATVVNGILHFFGNSVEMVGDYLLSFPNGNGIWIVWGCTGIKQAVILTVILLASRGMWQRKIWFIPLGWVLCYGINILRITLLTVSVENHVDKFPLLHGHLSKYLFYLIIFLFWLWWEEKIGRHKVSSTND